MWLLPSKNRPDQCREALEAFKKFGCTPGVLWVDGDPKGYDKIILPDGWVIKHGSGGIGEACKWQYRVFPDREWYGWMADDMRPETIEFDLKLIYECRGVHFVFCNGGDHKSPKYAPAKGDVPDTIPSVMMWGGKLLEAVGWYFPPWLTRTCADEAWKHLAKAAGVAVYKHDVIVRHLHWLSGGRDMDGVDMEAWNSSTPDRKRLSSWMNSDEFDQDVLRITNTLGSKDERHRVLKPWNADRSAMVRSSQTAIPLERLQQSGH